MAAGHKLQGMWGPTSEKSLSYSYFKVYASAEFYEPRIMATYVLPRKYINAIS